MMASSATDFDIRMDKTVIRSPFRHTMGKQNETVMSPGMFSPAGTQYKAQMVTSVPFGSFGGPSETTQISPFQQTANSFKKDKAFLNTTALVTQMNIACFQTLTKEQTQRQEFLASMSPRKRAMFIQTNSGYSVGVTGVLPVKRQEMGEGVGGKETLSEIYSNVFSESQNEDFDRQDTPPLLGELVKDIDFQATKTKVKVTVARKYKEDVATQALIDKEKQHCEEQGINYETYLRFQKRKRAPLQKRRSFTDCGMKFDDVLDMKLKYKKKDDGVEKNTMELMGLAGKFPIQEKLLSRPKNYVLQLDSLINETYNAKEIEKWSRFKDLIKAPNASEASDEVIDMYYSSGAEKKQDVTLKNEGDQNEGKWKSIDPRVYKICNFDTEQLDDYPFRARENEIPWHVLKRKKFSEFSQIAKEVALMFGVKEIAAEKDSLKLRAWTLQQCQTVFEYYCYQFKAIAPSLDKFLIRNDNGWWKLSFRNYQLNEPTLKALACALPFYVQIEEVQFLRNQISDQVGCTLAMAIFMNPSIRFVTCDGNFLKGCFFQSMCELMRQQPDKILKLSLVSSIQFQDSLEMLIKTIPANRFLSDLNVSGNTFSLNTANQLSKYMIHHGHNLRDLNISGCNISYQGTRYIIDALNKNTSIRFFNFTGNDLSSSQFEYSIKLGAIVTRHPNLMHLDISNCGLRREEVLFMGLALYMSKTILAIHMSGNQLPYYDRIFLRTLTCARVQYSFRNDAAKQDDKLRNNKEFTQALHLNTGKNYNNKLKEYIAAYNDLDEERKGLDFEMEDLLKEIDTEKEFKHMGVNFANMTDVPKQSKLSQLMDKIKERNVNLKSQRETCIKALNDRKNMTELMAEAAGVSQNLKDLALDKNGNPAQLEGKAGVRPKSKQGDVEADKNRDIFEQAQAFKVERQRQKAEQDLAKEKDRSAGEQALMFMGINQLADQLQRENPMAGYMQQLIFTRILGCDELQEAHYWVDCNQCWVCGGWNQMNIAFHPVNDRRDFNKKVDNLNKLEGNIQHAVKKSLEEEGIWDEIIDDLDEIKEYQVQLDKETMEAIRQKELNEIKEQVEEDESEVEGLSKADIDSEEGLSDGTIAAEEQGPKKEPKGKMTNEIDLMPPLPAKMAHLTLNTQNPIQVVQAQHDQIKKVTYADNYESIQKFGTLDLRHEIDFMEAALKRGQLIPRVINFGAGSRRPVIPSNLLPPSFQLAGKGSQPTRTFSRGSQLSSQESQRSGFSTRIKKLTKDGNKVTQSELDPHEKSVMGGYSEFDDNETVRTSTLKVKRRVRGQPVLVEREVFFKGMVYIIEEEVYSDSDRSSCYTSEDDFEKQKDLSKSFHHAFPLLNKTIAQKATDQQKKWDAWDDQDSKNRGPEPKGHRILWPQDEVSKQLKRKEKEKEFLTAAQREYQNKLLPKQYMEKQKAMRVTKFNTTEYEIAAKALSKKKRRTKRRVQEKLRFELQKKAEYIDKDLIEKLKQQIVELETDSNLDGAQEKEGPIYVVASCHDWMPVKMKTKRVMHLEKIPMQEPAPPTMLNYDNVTLTHAAYVQPGTHYFYFVQGRNQIFLSPKYPAVRFKNTNIFLNRIKIRPKVHEFEAVFTLKEGVEDEELFLIDHSVFARYEVEQMPARTRLLRKCFDTDISFSKLDRVCKNNETDIRLVEMKLWEHYPKLLNIFLYEIRRDDLGVIGWIDFTTYCKMNGIIDDVVLQTDQFDRAFISTNVNTHGLINSAERNLQRYEFLEMVVRLSRIKYIESGKMRGTAAAIDKLLNEEMYPNVQEANGHDFRIRHCYNVKVNEILRKNSQVIDKIYKDKNSTIQFHQKKKYIRLDELKVYIHAMNLKPAMSEYIIGAIYYESIIAIPDTIRSKRMTEMQPSEFIVFICKMTHVFYQGTVYQSELLHIKLEKMLPFWLRPIYLDPVFTHGEEFEYDIKVRKKKERAYRKAMGQENSQDEESDEEEDEDDEDEEDDLKYKPKDDEAVIRAEEEKAKRLEEEKQAAIEADEALRKRREEEQEEEGEGEKEEESGTHSSDYKSNSQSEGADSQASAVDENETLEIVKGMSKSKLQRVTLKLFQKYDANSDGILEIKEFVNFVQEIAKISGEEVIIVKNKTKGNSMWHAMYQTFINIKDGQLAWEEVWGFVKENSIDI